MLNWKLQLCAQMPAAMPKRGLPAEAPPAAATAVAAMMGGATPATVLHTPAPHVAACVWNPQSTLTCVCHTCKHD
jgi:hypothetical protein